MKILLYCLLMFVAVASQSATLVVTNISGLPAANASLTRDDLFMYYDVDNIGDKTRKLSVGQLWDSYGAMNVLDQFLGIAAGTNVTIQTNQNGWKKIYTINANAATNIGSAVAAGANVTITTNLVSGQIVYTVSSTGGGGATNGITGTEATNIVIGTQPFIDVFYSYNAAASTNTTTGSVSSNSTTLTVASTNTFFVGQGIFVDNARFGGSNLITHIMAVGATTITLSNAATATVAGVKVQHDDTMAINAALAAAKAARGGIVYLRITGTPHGYYRANGPIITNTDSILSIYADSIGIGVTEPTQMRFIGERGPRSLPGISDFEAGSGVVIDTSDADQPAESAGFYPAMLSGAKWQAADLSSSGRNLDLFVDGIGFMGATNSSISGVMFSHIQRGSLGNEVRIINKFNFLDLDAWAPTKTNSFGVWFSAVNNGVQQDCGSAFIAGFHDLVRGTEHLLMLGTYMYLGQVGLRAMSGNYPISAYGIKMENCAQLVARDNAYLPTYGSTIDIIMQCELKPSGHWFSTTNSFNDPLNGIHGRLRYYAAVGGNRSVTTNLLMTANGFENVSVDDGYSPIFQLSSGGSISTNIISSVFGTTLSGNWFNDISQEFIWRDITGTTNKAWMTLDQTGDRRIVGFTNGLAIRSDGHLGLSGSAVGAVGLRIDGTTVSIPNLLQIGTNSDAFLMSEFGLSARRIIYIETTNGGIIFRGPATNNVATFTWGDNNNTNAVVQLSTNQVMQAVPTNTFRFRNSDSVAWAVTNNGNGTMDIGLSSTGTISSAASIDLPWFNVMDYFASGISNDLSGSIASASSTLTIATNGWSVGMGVWVEGAGTGGTNFMTFVQAVNSTTLTLSNAAGTSVVSGLVKHNDAPALNAALAAAKAAGGGNVLVPLGQFPMLSPLDPTTRGVINFFGDQVTVASPMQIRIIGESRPYISTNYNTLVGGTILDFRRAQRSSGEFSSAIAASRFIRTRNADGFLTNYHNIGPSVENIGILMTNLTTLAALQFGNASQSPGVKDVIILAEQSLGLSSAGWTNNGALNSNTNAIGWIPPQAHNGVQIEANGLQVFGMWAGLSTTEHMTMNEIQIFMCEKGITVWDSAHPVTGRNLAIELCHDPIYVDPLTTEATLDFTVHAEFDNPAKAWGSTNLVNNDPAGVLNGDIVYSAFSYVDNAFVQSGGSANVRFKNLKTGAFQGPLLSLSTNGLLYPIGGIQLQGGNLTNVSQLGGSGSQTPLTADVNGASFSITNLNNLEATNTISANGPGSGFRFSDRNKINSTGTTNAFEWYAIDNPRVYYYGPDGVAGNLLIIYTNGAVGLKAITNNPVGAFAGEVEGAMFYDSTIKKMKFYNGTAWETVTSAP